MKKLALKTLLPFLAVLFASAIFALPASAETVTVDATKYVLHKDSPLTASVTYDDSFGLDESTGAKAPTMFTFNVQGSTKNLNYRVYSLYLDTNSGRSQVWDTSRGISWAKYTGTNYFEETFCSAGTYTVYFEVCEITPNGDGTSKLENITRFEFTFTIPESSSRVTLESKVQKIVDECIAAGNADDYSKALWLSDWLVKNSKYDDSLIYMGAEGVLARGKGTCEAYHAGYSMLLNKAGIQTRRVESTGDGHVWTGVLLNGKWYHVDTTWNNDATYFDIDHARLYFALPNDIIKLVHTQWNGNYVVQRDVSAPFEANSYEDNYFIKSGEILQYSDPYLTRAQQHLAAKETSFSIDIDNANWPGGYKNVIYSLVAYQLEHTDWGNPDAVVKVAYADDKLAFTVDYNTGSQTKPTPPSGNQGESTSPDSSDTQESSGNSDNQGNSGDSGGQSGSGEQTQTTSPSSPAPSTPTVNQGGSSSAESGNQGSSANQGSTSPQVVPAEKPGQWVQSGALWWYRHTDGTYPANCAKVIGGKTYRFDGSGWMRAGWVKENGKWYWHGSWNDGAMCKGWLWDGAWYYLDPSDGAMRTGWYDVSGQRYYSDGSGAMRTGWVLSDGRWYYMNGSGAMCKGWQWTGGAWYYLDPSGGVMRTGWYDVSGQRYYSDGSGAMRTGWVWLGGTWYYLHGSGAMAANCWIGNYWLQEDGSMATSKRVDGGRYYVDGSGAWVPGA